MKLQLYTPALQYLLGIKRNTKAMEDVPLLPRIHIRLGISQGQDA